MKKSFIIFMGLALAINLSACKRTVPSEPVSETPSISTSVSTSTPPVSESSSEEEEVVVYGLPTPEIGHYMRDADVVELASGERYLVYITNAESGEEDDVIAIRHATYDAAKGHAYGDEKVIVEPSAADWDKYVGAPSLTKGSFKYEGSDYAYLLAYHGTNLATGNANSIGFAVANDPLGVWKKVGSAPILTYNAAIYGESYLGYHAPSLVNLDKGAIVRLFWTWADAYGHFTYFVDFDGADLSALDLSGFAMLPNNGNLSSGDDVTMVPNADFAYDAEAKDFYMVKDYSPAATKLPRVSTRIELAVIAEAELYTTEQGNGWESLGVYVFLDTPEGAYERLYSGTIVSDEFGHVLDKNTIELIYNISELEADTPNYLFTQRLATIVYTA